MFVADQTLLVTGGTGSFGKTLVQDLLKTDIKEIRVLSRDEKKQEEMREHFASSKVTYFIGDIRDRLCLENAMDGVDFVFHAAALKQVPSCEINPFEAVKTNILGVQNALDVACIHRIKKFVLLSTDKAVYPINAMGISKAMAERLVVARARRRGTVPTTFCATRYGNVMGSRGSVIPLFVKLLVANKNLTVTDPSMTRFLMSLESSVTLVKKAFADANHGDTFVLKSPGCSIITLAEAMKLIFNSSSNIDIIGARHGEKRHETLVASEEMMRAKELDHFYQIASDDRSLN